jgi:hypothetical protein
VPVLLPLVCICIAPVFATVSNVPELSCCKRGQGMCTAIATVHVCPPQRLCCSGWAAGL